MILFNFQQEKKPQEIACFGKVCLRLWLQSSCSSVLLLEWIRVFGVTSYIYKTTVQITTISLNHTLGENMWKAALIVFFSVRDL
jgi:hypothetical protein